VSTCNADCYANHPDLEPVPCQFCGVPTHMAGTKCCDRCWSVSRGLEIFLRSYAGREYARRMLSEYLEEFEGVQRGYSPHVGDDKLCVCGHPYYRHFDTYDDMADVGCKYCECDTFSEKPQ
jgi:hypothetical protein